jgi:predicted ArsR family transcriptional regulator
MVRDKRFFESSRGRIVSLLRDGRRTVNELAAELGLTDNAIRAHLASLERDGLVRQSGIQPGTRKPHFAYQLTSEAERLFPKAYDVLLNQLITTLKLRMGQDEIENVLREVGSSLAKAQSGPGKGGVDSRIDRGVQALSAIGGAAKVERTDDRVLIQGEHCPLASAVAQHPEICQLAESLLAEIIGTQVHEVCDRSGSPKCRFEISAGVH